MLKVDQGSFISKYNTCREKMNKVHVTWISLKRCSLSVNSTESGETAHGGPVQSNLSMHCVL